MHQIIAAIDLTLVLVFSFLAISVHINPIPPSSVPSDIPIDINKSAKIFYMVMAMIFSMNGGSLLQ